ncbi:MAG: alpha/beta fold hydrolase [Candidatus Melainabacteria bacterium]|nr:alpha/beta fold hydrolase [Candidatus Melainabacteria bacterium]
MSLLPQRQTLLHLGAKFLRVCVLSALIASFIPSQSMAGVVRQDEAKLAQQVGLPVYEWKSDAVEPQAVAILVHGLTMHGAIYDKLARHLADQGFIVLAPDLHGYGRWTEAPSAKRHCNECGAQVCYQKSRRDLVGLVDSAKQTYPSLPLYMIGESLGADMVLYSVGQRPRAVDGIVLSSPAIKRRFNMVPRVFWDVSLLTHNLYRQVNLVPYMKKFASEDPRIIEEAVHDPLVRKKMTTWELFKTIQTIRPTLSYAEKVPANMPVLVIQGDKDRMLKTNGVCDLLKHLSSQDRTVRWFKDRGHLLLETAYLQDETLSTVDGWLKEHLNNGKFVQASVQGSIKNESLENN